MAATLNVHFQSPSTVGSAANAITAALQRAFADWTQHFDYTTGNYIVLVSIPYRTPDQALDVSASIGSGVSAGMRDSHIVSAQELGLELTGRMPVHDDAFPALYLSMSAGYLDGTLPLSSAVSAAEREMGYAFGISSRLGSPSYGSSGSSATLYDGSVVLAKTGTSATAVFQGPNAQVAYGGPVPVLSDHPNVTTVNGGRTVNTVREGAATVQPLDVAMLRDAGLPALSDQELAEHQVARLYVAAFGRNADSAGLLRQFAGLRGGLTLAQLGDGFVSSSEFSGRYGVLSDADFVSALYQNVLGRAGDASGVAFFRGALARGASRGAILAALADSDEERGRLNDNPNVTYAATAEAQVARLYDAAFGRYADPVGFTSHVRALVSGSTLQQVALSFLGSVEFTSRYGTAPSDVQFVDALYANTLHRVPNAAEEAQQVRALGAGLSRADTLATFADSQEHIDLMARSASAKDAYGLGTDLLPHLGIIPTIIGSVSGYSQVYTSSYVTYSYTVPTPSLPALLS